MYNSKKILMRKCLLSLISGFIAILLLFIILPSSSQSQFPQDNQFQKGMAFPTWQAQQYCSPESDESLRILAQRMSTEWVQFVPTWYQKDKYATEILPEYEGRTARPWDWASSGAVDLIEQALCYHSVIKTFSGKPWFKGIYWWNWEPDPQSGGIMDNGYTPQEKPAGEIVKRWYSEISLKKKGMGKR